MTPLGAILVAALALAPVSASAHTRSQSFSTWRLEEDGRIRMTFSVQAREVTRLWAVEDPALSDLGALLARHVTERVAVRAEGTACTAGGSAHPLAARAGFVRVEREFLCPPGRAVEIEVDTFFDLASTHVHFARIFAPGARVVERLVTRAERRIGVGGAQPEGATLASYVALGIEHILVGIDHVVFLASLLLLGGRLRTVVGIVTGFTLGHSLTLSLAVLGLARPDGASIEALIGFTIALVAAENVSVRAGFNRPLGAAAAAALGALALGSALGGTGLPVATLLGLALFTPCYLALAADLERARRLRPAVTLLFGLVHGFGFASVLMDAGLPRNRLLPALFGFNVGVEIGQLAVVTVLWSLGAALARRLPVERRLAADALSAGLAGLGLFWFLGRGWV